MSASKRDGPFKLYDAEGLCPICKVTHWFKLNPGYAPPVARGKLGGKAVGRKYSIMTWGERCLYYFFRVLCDRCLSQRASKGMRANLAEKGWSVK